MSKAVNISKFQIGEIITRLEPVFIKVEQYGDTVQDAVGIGHIFKYKGIIDDSIYLEQKTGYDCGKTIKLKRALYENGWAKFEDDHKTITRREAEQMMNKYSSN